MKKEVRTVKRNDAELTRAALDITHAYTHAEYGAGQAGGLEAQKAALKANTQAAIEALEGKASKKQLGVIETVWLAGQQVRALIDSGK
jgi:hypothetical protein